MLTNISRTATFAVLALVMLVPINGFATDDATVKQPQRWLPDAVEHYTSKSAPVTGGVDYSEPDGATRNDNLNPAPDYKLKGEPFTDPSPPKLRMSGAPVPRRDNVDDGYMLPSYRYLLNQSSGRGNSAPMQAEPGLGEASKTTLFNGTGANAQMKGAPTGGSIDKTPSAETNANQKYLDALKGAQKFHQTQDAPVSGGEAYNRSGAVPFGSTTGSVSYGGSDARSRVLNGSRERLREAELNKPSTPSPMPTDSAATTAMATTGEAGTAGAAPAPVLASGTAPVLDTAPPSTAATSGTVGPLVSPVSGVVLAPRTPAASLISRSRCKDATSALEADHQRNWDKVFIGKEDGKIRKRAPSGGSVLIDYQIFPTGICPELDRFIFGLGINLPRKPINLAS